MFHVFFKTTIKFWKNITLRKNHFMPCFFKCQKGKENLFLNKICSVEDANCGQCGFGGFLANYCSFSTSIYLAVMQKFQDSRSTFIYCPFGYDTVEEANYVPVSHCLTSTQKKFFSVNYCSLEVHRGGLKKIVEHSKYVILNFVESYN